MRYIAFIALSVVAMLDFSFGGLVDAGEKTTVGVWANAWDEREDDSGCSPDGCTADLTRDGSLKDESRWSCKYDLKKKTCELCFSFAEPQDIVDVEIALWKGDTRTRTIDMIFTATEGDTFTKRFTSSGKTDDFETIPVDSDETQKLCMKPVGLENDEWLSILETCVWILRLDGKRVERDNGETSAMLYSDDPDVNHCVEMLRQP